MIRMPASSASRGPENRTGRPFKWISPSNSVIAPARIFMSVLLPAPFSPQMAWTSPAAAVSDTSRSARTPPKLLAMCRISSRGPAAAGAKSWGPWGWFMGKSIHQGMAASIGRETNLF